MTPALRADAVLTDIEGTTSSISFVKEVLFPYAAQALPAWLEEHWDQAEVREQVDEIEKLTGRSGLQPDSCNAILQQWIQEDRKATPLKSLQGKIWADGYRQGVYQAHMYPDATAALQQWHQQGIPLYVYSSGSIAAQKLFFGFSVSGDLTPLFSGYFDTTSGGKKESRSYRNIINQIGLPAERIVFLSDITEELDAAHSAGLQTILLDRSHSAPPSISSAHIKVDSFADIHLKKTNA